MRLSNRNDSENYKSIERLSLAAFLSELPNLIAVVIASFVTATSVVWVDCVNSVGETLHCYIVFIVARMMKKENGDRFNYGMDRMEVFVSFICDTIVCFGMLAVFAGAVYALIRPQQPAESLFSFLILKCINITFDGIFLYNACKNQKKHRTRMTESEVKNYTKATVCDAVVGIVVSICWFFRTQLWARYVNPVVSIILIMFFLAVYVRRIREAIRELSDAALPVENQDELFDIVMSRPEIIKRIREVNCHALNRKVYVDVCLTMAPAVTYEQQRAYLDTITKEIREKIPECRVRLVIEEE